jgi:hypothetical protein
MDNLLARLESTNTAIEGGLFHDIGIVPAQFYPGRRDAAQTEPMRKLMTAILVLTQSSATEEDNGRP